MYIKLYYYTGRKDKYFSVNFKLLPALGALSLRAIQCWTLCLKAMVSKTVLSHCPAVVSLNMILNTDQL